MSVSLEKNDNTWLFTTHLVDPKTGDRIHKTRQGYKSLQESEETEYEFRREYFKVKVEGCQITFKEMFIKYKISRKQEIKPTTYKNWMNLYPMTQKKFSFENLYLYMAGWQEDPYKKIQS